MYIRTKTSPRSKNISVQIVEAQRIDGKIKQNVIRHLGTAVPGEALEKLKHLARRIIVEIQQDALRSKASHLHDESSRLGTLVPVPEDLRLQARSLEESQRVILGLHEIYGSIYRSVGFMNPFSQPKRNERAANILREIVMARIAQPQSKRASVRYLIEQCGVAVNLNQVYWMMDKVDDPFCKRIQECALAATLQLTGERVRILFYDVTTLYFESFIEDELKQNGYSKDMKFNQPQVLLALFVTQRGLPVGYELFPGSTFEGHTLQVALHRLKERYQIEQVVVVADRGMLSESNLRFLQEHHYAYVVGAKLRALDELGQQEVLGWIQSVDKHQVVGELTHRIRVTPGGQYPIRIFGGSLTEAALKSLTKRTYVLWREEQQWHFAIYEHQQCEKIIPLSDVEGLEQRLTQIPETEQKLSRQERKIITTLILAYHRQPQWLVLSYRRQRALKDRGDREKALEKLKARLKRSKNPKQLISRYGFHKLIKVEGEAELQIDEQKLLEESQWDGISGVYLSDPQLSNEEALEHYRGLWQVEESFRIQKHDLKIRPIYHWTPRRIKAHIAISFMAFVCVRYLEYRIATQSQKLSPKTISDALTQYQASVIQDQSTQKTYLLPSKITPEIKEIYRVLGLKPKQGLQEIQCSA